MRWRRRDSQRESAFFRDNCFAFDAYFFLMPHIFWGAKAMPGRLGQREDYESKT